MESNKKHDDQKSSKQCTSIAPLTIPSCHGPRTVLLHRTENGFGFTLRHFIVYPPDTIQIENNASSSNKENDENAVSSSSLEPMDTIFVKHIREGGPAHRAGLATGDRIVSVNGETISGKTYSEVVQLIQKSRNSLQLLVVPKEDDILQLYFPGTAYHGETTSLTRDPSSKYKKPSSDLKNFHSFPSTNFSSSSSSSLSSLNNPHYDDSNRETPAFPTSLTHENGEIRREEPVERFKPSDYTLSSQPNCSLTSKTSSKDFSSNSLTRGNISDTHHAYPFNYEPYLPTSFTHQQSSNIYFSNHPSSFSKTDIKPEDSYANIDKQSQHSKTHFLWENASQSLPSNSHQKSGYSQNMYMKSSHFSETTVKSNCNGEKFFQDLGKCQLDNKDFLSECKTPSNQMWHGDNDRFAERLKQSLERKEKFLLKSNDQEDSASDTSLNFPQPSMFIVNRDKSKEFSQQSKLNQLSWTQKLSGLKPLQVNDRSGNSHDNQDNNSEILKTQIVEKSAPVNHDMRSVKNQIISGIGSVKFHTYSNNLNSDKNISTINEHASTSSLNASEFSHNHVTSSNCFKPYFTPSSFQHKVITPKRASSFLRKASSLDSDVPKPSALRPVENQQVLQFQLVSQRTKQFESGSVDDEAKNRTNLYRNELCRLTSKCQTPSVSLRTAQFESLSSSQDTCSSEEVNPHTNHLKQKREKQDFKWQRSYSDSVSCGLSSATTVAELSASSFTDDGEKCKNSLYVPSMAISSRKIPSNLSGRDLQIHDAAEIENDSISKYSFNYASADEDEFPRKKAVRQNSYLQAVQSPYKGVSSLAITVSATTSTTNSITTTATKTSSTSLMGPYFALAGIVSERKAFYEDEPLTAAVTNAKSRNHKLLEGNLDKGQAPDKNETPCNRAQNIQKLKAFFGEKTPQILEATERHSSSSSSEILKEGFLHCKVILIDGKRSTDRSWKQFWGCLRGTTLFLYRDKISQQLLSPEEQALALKPVSADVAYNYTKKKNVFQLIASNGTEYLFQAEDNEEMQDWIYYIQNHCINDNMNVENQYMTSRASDNLSRLSPQPIQKRIKKLTSFRNRSPTNQSPVVKNRKTIHGEDIFPKAKTWKGKMVKTIRKIHGTSSNSPDVPEGVTINVPLEDCPSSSINEYLPLFVELCTSIVEARGLEMVGIYRVPGNTAAVTALLDAVNKGFDNLNLQDPRWNDVNVISSMLKGFFRKLPDPLITSELYPFFIAANKITDNSQKLYTFKKLLHELPDHHYETLKFLIKHLRKIVAHSIVNKMEARNLAIVFGPTLVRAADDNMATMVTDMSHQCCIVETLVTEAEWFFDDENDYNWEYYSKNDMLQDKNSVSYDNLILNNAKSTLDASNSEAVNAKEIIASIIAAANEVSKNKTKKFSVCSAPAIGDHMNYDSHDGNQNMECGNNQLHSFYSTIKPRSAGIETRNNEIGNHIFHSGKRTASADSLSTFQDSHRRLKESSYEMNHDRYLNPRTSNHDPMSTPSNNIFDDGILKSYAGLSASTQERIRRFELETRALLQRDLNRQQRENEQRQAERERIELEWQKAKQELEQDDPLDVLADNLSATSSKTSESVSNVSKSSNDLTDSKPIHRFRVNPVKISGSPAVRPSGTKHSLANRKTHLHYDSSEELKKNFLYFNGKEDSLRLNSSDTRHALDLLTNGGNSSNQSEANVQFGSLDSIQGLSERSMSSITSSEESDLMSSITATLNHRLSKLQDSNTILSSGNRTSKFNPCKGCNELSVSDVHLLPSNEKYCPYRDPSLHRNQEVLTSFEDSVASHTKAFNEQLNKMNKNIQENINTPPRKHVNKFPNQQFTVDAMSSNFAKQIHTPLDCGEKGTLEESSDNSKITTSNITTENSVTNQQDLDEASPEVQVHRNEHTLITATISTTKQTVTSSSTTAIITATIVTTPSKKKTFDVKTSNSDSKCVPKISDLKKSQKEMTNISEKNIKGNKTLASSKVTQENSVFKMSDEAVSSSFPLQKNRTKQNNLKRRHTVGGTKDFDKFQFLLSKNMPIKDSHLSAWERLQPEMSGNDLSSPPRTMNNWLERERLRMSFPNLTPVKIPIEF